MIALVVAMSGAAIALPGHGSVDAGDIKRDAIRSKQIKAQSVRGSDVAANALTGEQVLESKLGPVPAARTVETVNLFGDSYERVLATDGADLASAQAAAPPVTLASRGELSVYGKCFRNASTDALHGRIYVKTSTAGAIFEADGASLEGGATAADLLNPSTPEDARELLRTNVGAGAAGLDRGQWYAMAPDGTGIGGTAAIALKNGDLAGGNGLYGTGNVCL
ncbi:MAG TPA: hypothetical protein VID76_10190, partial [Solirubrobacterales bacterium]